MSSNKNEKTIRNLIRLTKKELKDLRFHDILADPKLNEAFRRAKPKHWSELTEDERESQAKEQAKAEQQFVREQKILKVKRFLQSIMKVKCVEPNSNLFTTAEELLEFVVKYESSPSSVSNYEWNRFETVLLVRLESLLLAEGKETKQGIKMELGEMHKWYQTNTFKFVVIPLVIALFLGIPAWFSLGNKTNHGPTASTNIFADVSKDGSILRSNKFPWEIRKSKDRDGNILYTIVDRRGDATAISVKPDKPKYTVYQSWDGMVIKYTCPEEEISNFTIKLKY